MLPRTSGKSSASSSALNFSYVEEPFSFVISRSSTGESLFNTSAASLIFETQYVRLRTYVPENPNLYGLGEHTDPFKLNSTNYIRTLWSQDNYGVGFFLIWWMGSWSTGRIRRLEFSSYIGFRGLETAPVTEFVSGNLLLPNYER